tara:strand:+ start:8577 stop:10004 length:1428 start_codon:yes stop_codon:yes gene_type:complete
MKFLEFEEIMAAHGITTLADIARSLNTTPQAVSNWKGRDQVPHHIVAKLRSLSNSQNSNVIDEFQLPKSMPQNAEAPIISLSDIFLTLAKQVKVIFLTSFIAIFFTVTYVKFIQTPNYLSRATILLPEGKSSNFGGLAGFASQFGMNLPNEKSTDLSSPDLFPDLLRSRTFAEKIIGKPFFTLRANKNLPLLEILNGSSSVAMMSESESITKAMTTLKGMIDFEENLSGNFYELTVTTFEPVFAKELAIVVLNELESLNSFYKMQIINEKIKFINQRISTVKSELEDSEFKLKAFNEQNRQVSSPSLILQQDRLARNVEVQKEIFLTLKQQLELAKIEEIQGASIMQVLDAPNVPLSPENKNLKLSIFVAIVFGLTSGVIIALIRGTIQQLNREKRKKLNKGKKFLRNKVKDFLTDRKLLAIVLLILTTGLPYYIGFGSIGNLYSLSSFFLYKYLYIFSITAVVVLLVYNFIKGK